ncbi:MAG: imelysin family protein [Pseudomonadota bacterium]
MAIRNFRNLMLVTAALALTACGGGGGGGGGGNNPPPPPPPADPLGPVGSVADEQDRLFMSIGDNFVVPRYAAMMTAMGGLETAATDYCANPAAGDLSTFQDAWRDAMTAWQAITIIRFGPVEENNRRLRIQFFPDENDAVLNNVTQVLNNGLAIDETLIAGSAVGAQGLPAMEYLLFDLGGLDDAVDGPRRCELAVAVAQNLSTMADELATAWDPAGQLLADFTSASGTFTDRADVLTEILESMALETEFVADEKITRPIAVGSQATESFRSEFSRENLIANTDALRTLLDIGTAATDYGLTDYLRRAHSADPISTQLNDQLQAAQDGLDVLTASIEAIILGTETGDIDIVRTSMQDLADSFIDAAVAADVNLGFSNQDGD